VDLRRRSESRQQSWIDTDSGLSLIFRGRGIGFVFGVTALANSLPTRRVWTFRPGPELNKAHRRAFDGSSPIKFMVSPTLEHFPAK